MKKILSCTIFIMSYSFLLSMAAEASSKVLIRLSQPICGDCCIGKASTIPGVLTLEGVQVGDPNVTFVYDPDITTPKKIIAALKEKGKKGKIVKAEPTSVNDSKEKWVRPIRNTGVAK